MNCSGKPVRYLALSNQGVELCWWSSPLSAYLSKQQFVYSMDHYIAPIGESVYNSISWGLIRAAGLLLKIAGVKKNVLRREVSHDGHNRLMKRFEQNWDN